MKTLGIIGGLGPMATAYLTELIINMTDVKTDQEHIDTIIFNRPDVPDRTAYILDRTQPSPLPKLLETAAQLEKLGASYIATPCVTAHYFYRELSQGVGVPFINMVSETAAALLAEGAKKAGIMATTGTICTELFQTALAQYGIDCALPEEQLQGDVMSLIYDDVKTGHPADMDKFHRVTDSLFERGCDSVILGCTELSVIKRDEKLGAGFIDALEVLAKRSVELCQKPVKPEFSRLITK